MDQMPVQQMDEAIAFAFTHSSLLKLEVLKPGH